MALDNGTCAKIEYIFGYLYFIFILLIQLVFSYRGDREGVQLHPLHGHC